MDTSIDTRSPCLRAAPRNADSLHAPSVDTRQSRLCAVGAVVVSASDSAAASSSAASAGIAAVSNATSSAFMGYSGLKRGR